MLRKVFLLCQICICLLLSIGSIRSFAQDEGKGNIENAAKLLDGKTASLEKYLDRSGGIQQRLLKRLQRKEQKMLKKLAAKDSILYLIFRGC